MANNNILPKILSYSIGLLFIISGYSKAADFNYFVAIINNYISNYAGLISFMIIIGELVIGLLFIFEIAIKYVSLVCIGLIIIFTAVYTYGITYLGVTDCGCFGKAQFINGSPVFLYARNLLIIIISILLYRSNANNSTRISLPTLIISIIMVSIGALLCGRFYNRPETLSNLDSTQIPLSEHPLNNYIKISPDSTYLIAVFSYDCPHCINSIGNLMQYKLSNHVDEIIGLCIENPTLRSEFNDFFHPNFRIIELPESEIYNITESYPKLYFIKDNTILRTITGEIPSAYFVKSYKL